MEQSRKPTPAEQLAATRAASSTTTTAKPSTRESGTTKRSVRSIEPQAASSEAVSVYPSLATYKDGELVALKVTSTLIGNIIYKNNILDYCPKKLYETYLTANNNNPPTESMQKGLYFESLLLGKGRTGSLFELPRLRNGNKSIDQIRIEEQVNMAEMVFKMYGIEIFKKGKSCNVQIESSMAIEYKEYPDIDFSLSGGMDIISPISVPKTNYNYDAAVIDIKLTMSRFNEHGKYCWALPQYMDLTQGVLYSTLTGIPFFYLVFDYKEKRGNGHLLLPVATMAMFPNGYSSVEEEQYYNVAKQRQSDLRVNIKTVIEQVIMMHAEGYPERPSYSNCDMCPISKLYPGGTCEYVNFIKKI